MAAYRQELLRDGFVEGKNLVFDVRTSEGADERLPGLAAELFSLKPDVLIASSTPAALAAQRATSTVPVVFAVVSDPEGSGLVKSLAHPGGNITGVTDFGVDLAGKTLQMVREIVPGASNVAVLASDNPVHPRQLRALQTAAKSMGVSILPFVANTPGELEQVFVRMLTEKAAAVIALGGSRQVGNRDQIARLALNARLASLFPVAHYVEAGGLMSCGPSLEYQHRLAAGIVRKILHGRKPEDLPVLQPNEIEVTINMKTAKALGIAIPQAILLRADRLIE